MRLGWRWLRRLYAWAWRHRLEPGEQVVYVLGWRTATIDNRFGGRRVSTWMFKGLFGRMFP